MKIIFQYVFVFLLIGCGSTKLAETPVDNIGGPDGLKGRVVTSEETEEKDNIIAAPKATSSF